MSDNEFASLVASIGLIDYFNSIDFSKTKKAKIIAALSTYQPEEISYYISNLATNWESYYFSSDSNKDFCAGDIRDNSLYNEQGYIWVIQPSVGEIGYDYDSYCNIRPYITIPKNIIN